MSQSQGCCALSPTPAHFVCQPECLIPCGTSVRVSSRGFRIKVILIGDWYSDSPAFARFNSWFSFILTLCWHKKCFPQVLIVLENTVLGNWILCLGSWRSWAPRSQPLIHHTLGPAVENNTVGILWSPVLVPISLMIPPFSTLAWSFGKVWKWHFRRKKLNWAEPLRLFLRVSFLM